ncbi:MAG: ATP-dependent DNA helicase [Candidatus Omnitrophota bacterium]|nr:ATP-dependent DNA helicase [Candidatus Omnitrophota bacterium]
MEDFERYYRELNIEQRKAVDTVEGPVLVLAGPGTGKTQILSVRAANIILHKKALPENILILTYTNSAAKTMKERLAKIIGFKGYDVYVATFHSFANAILLDSEEAANYIQERVQIEDIDQIKALEYILGHAQDISEIRPFNAPYHYVKDIKKRISDLKREGVSPKEFLGYVKTLKPDGAHIEEKHIPRIKALAVIYDQYEKLKISGNKDVFDERGRYDYDDMIMMAIDALSKEPVLRKKYQEQYKFFMVDEFQDTNGGQLKLLFSILEGDSPNICCVGDDDQSIYRFQGASVGNFKELKKKFKDLETISLKSNYRSTKEIIGLAESLIKEVPMNERTGDKGLINVKDFKNKSIGYYEFTGESEELDFIANKVRELREQIESSKELSPEEKENPYNNIAILVRKRDLILRIIDKFLRSGIPYATDGKEDIRPEPRVRQMLDVLEFASMDPENYEDRDRILYKILIADYFKIPLIDVLGLISKVNKKKRNKEDAKILLELFNSADLTRPLKNAGAVLKRLIDSAQFRPAHTVLMEYIEEAGIYKFILEKYNKSDVIRIRELRALSSFINKVKSADLSKPGLDLKDFIEEIRTMNEHGMPLEGDLVTMTQNGVRIFTAHGSKGQEFHSVIIPFCLQDKSWPIKPRTDSIPFPPELIKDVEKVHDKERVRELTFHDETRLFYVAVSRARSNIIFTASPDESAVSSAFLHRLGIKPKTLNLKEEDILVSFFEKTNLMEPFIGTDGVLSDLVKDMPLNPTSLDNYLRCRRKFLYDNVLMLPSAKKQSLIFGNAVHAALENLYREYIRKKKFPDFQFFKERFIEALKFQGPEKAMELRCKEQFEGLRKYHEKVSKKPVKPIGLENRMPVNIDGIIFTGKYDKLELEDEKNNFARVVDYKTGQPNKHAKGILEARSLEDEECDGYLRQLVCYKLLYERDKNRQDKSMVVSHGVLVFVEPAKKDLRKYGIKQGEPTEFKVEFREEMVDEIAGIIRNTWRDIQNLSFEKLQERDKDKCSYCDFDRICWEQGHI